jgi:hypothetical protein
MQYHPIMNPSTMDNTNISGYSWTIFFHINLVYKVSGSYLSCFRESRTCPTPLLFASPSNLKNHSIISVLKTILKHLNRYMTTVLPGSMAFSGLM